MDRKEEILRLIESGHKTAKELARYFKVSLMTIYRDLRELEEEGRIIRKHGNVELKREEEEIKENVCAVCGKDIDLRLAFIFIMRGGKKIHTCCAHCGLIKYKTIDSDRLEVIMTRDFITNNPINALSSTFVVGSTAVPCCQPSAFAFGNEEDAQKFVKGFGGLATDFYEAVQRMEELMKGGQRVDFSL
jgi:DeoR/GlpR family transcriptional regulator of sugar metabolism